MASLVRSAWLARSGIPHVSCQPQGFVPPRCVMMLTSEAQPASATLFAFMTSIWQNPAIQEVFFSYCRCSGADDADVLRSAPCACHRRSLQGSPGVLTTLCALCLHCHELKRFGLLQCLGATGSLDGLSFHIIGRLELDSSRTPEPSHAPTPLDSAATGEQKPE